MGKHPWLFAIIVLVLAGLIIGISATDMWQYIIDFCKVGIDLFVKWLNEIIRALRNSITSVTGTKTTACMQGLFFLS